mgnify:CR=1 FL=1
MREREKNGTQIVLVRRLLLREAGAPPEAFRYSGGHPLARTVGLVLQRQSWGQALASCHG